jgi:uncharacterized SAM-binding protein YcdF (DUF218 family)
VTYVQPLLLLFLLIGLGGIVRIRKCKGVRIPAAGLLGLFLVSWPPVDWLLSRHLEAWYSPVRVPVESAQAIVVLGSSTEPLEYDPSHSLPDQDTYERCEYAAWLRAHSHPGPVLACGGKPKRGKQPVSDTMRQLLERAGVPESMIWTEDRSRSTHENAVYGAAILKTHGIGTIVLVTEATDMLRAERCFRKEGLTVVPAPFAFRQLGPASEELMPGWKAVARNERTLHETLGLAWYWLRGWI